MVSEGRTREASVVSGGAWRSWSAGAFAVVCLLVLVGCGAGGVPEREEGFIVIEPGAVLLTAVGDAVQLRATVFDGAGNVVDVPVTWESAAPSVVGVDGAGLATAAVGLGSSQVVARTDSLESPPLLVIVAPTVEGAVLVRDEQVVDGPVAVDDLADYGPGWRYAVTLAGVPALVPGDLLVGTGAIALGGRVVAVVDVSGGVRVTLEIVGLDELFTALEINETLDLLHARPEFDDEVLAAYDIARHPDGSIEFVPRAAAASLVLPAQVTGVRALGVFDCSTTTTFPFSLPKAPQFTITPTVKMQLDYSLAAGLRKLGAEGAVKAEFKFEPKVSASFDGKLECEVELMAFPIPVGGPIALVIGGQVPIGVGFELKGKLVVAELGLDVNATGTATFGMGVTCPQGDCESYATGNLTVDPKVTPRLPNVDEQLRLSFSIEPFAFADLALGARSFKRLRIQLLRLTLGASQKLDLATASGQVADPAYASTFDLRALLKAKLGRDVTRALALLKVTIKPLELTLVDVLLAESPRGTFTIEPATVAPTTAEGAGDLATFTVTLSPTTYLGVEIVDRVEFMWLRDGVLGEGRTACSSLAASPGQSTFSCTTDFLEAHEGLQTFYAFVYLRLFGTALPVPLEIAKDAKATVTVGPSEPTVAWVRQFGGGFEGNRVGNGVTVDAFGNAYVVGSLVAKFGPDGALQWLHELPDNTRGQAVAVDASGDAYFVGWTSSTRDSWLEKRDVFGNGVWRVQLINPDNFLRAEGVAVSPTGTVVVTGRWMLGPGDGQNPVAFLATYSALGAEESFTLQPFPFDGEWGSEGRDVAVDALGNVYVAGQASRSSATDGGSHSYAYVAKYDASGGEVWIDRFSGGIGFSGAWGVAANTSADRVCVTGWIRGELEGQSSAGFGDAYVVCYDTSGTRLYMRQFGTEGSEFGEGIAMDEAGNVYVAGRTDGTFGSNLGGFLGGGTDAFLARYDSQGIQTHIWQFGTSEGDIANGVAVDGSGNVYVTGRTTGPMDTVGPVPGAFLVKVEGF